MELLYAIRRIELDICMKIFPKELHGFYTGECNGELISSFSTIPWTSTLRYGGLMIVQKLYRRKGFAALLRNDVANLHLPKDGVLVIDALEGILYNHIPM